MYQFTVGCPPLPSLRWLDWWHSNAAAKSGGINSLWDVLSAAPNLQYLSVGGEMWPSFLNTPPIHLAYLTTLRLRRANALLVLRLCTCALPALRHVIIDSAVNGEVFWPLWTGYGPQLRTIELGLSLKFYVQDFLAHVFAGCTQLQELNYHALFTHVPSTDYIQRSLTTVGLHWQFHSLFRVGSAEYWTHLERHFEALSQPAFPALQRVVLHGAWSAVMDDSDFARVTQSLRERGCTFEVASSELGT